MKQAQTPSKNNKKPTKKSNIFLKAANDKRIMIPILSVLTVCIISLIVLMVLEANGKLFYPNVKDNSGSGSSASDRQLLSEAIYESGSYQYRLLTDGTAELYFFTESYATEVDVPEVIDGYKVSIIGNECFVWLPSITKVTIPEGVTIIGANAFEGCGSLSSVYLPSTLKAIESYAFKDCPSSMTVYFSGDINDLSIAIGNTALTSSLK